MPVGEARRGVFGRRKGEGVPSIREWVIELVVMLAIGIALAALGPFGSFALGTFGARLTYWVPAALIGYAVFRPTLVAILLSRRLDLPELPAAVVGVLIGAFPATLAMTYWGAYRPGTEPSSEQMFQLYVQVALIGVLVMAVFLLMGRGPAPGVAPAVSKELPATPDPGSRSDASAAAPFLQRLPLAWRDRLVALEMEDHYVRAHSPGASALILLRMRDAEAELAGVDGLRIHRSWWVARDAIERVVRTGRNYRLQLMGGIEAPVARDRIAALKAASWID